MIFSDFKLIGNKPIYIQIKLYIINLIKKGLIPTNAKLPSSRELSQLLDVSRNSIVLAYEDLKSEGYIYSIKGKGSFIKYSIPSSSSSWNVNWNKLENDYCKTANHLDIIKSEKSISKDIISFKSISPNGELFDIDDLKKSFLNRISLEGDKILNYGYAQGYKPLIEYLLSYISAKGVNTLDKDILITNGFTEGLDIILSSLINKGDYILCENPTHNTSIKIMKSMGINIIGFNITKDGIDFDDLESKLSKYKHLIKFSYITPSYHNPTGIVISPHDRYKFYEIMKRHNIAIIEDGFNEELLYSSSHIFPICSLDNINNGVIYIGSFSKILFPGIRIGWILADKNLITKLESVKRCKNIHVSFLDQALLYDYLINGNFDRYIKKIKKYYKDKFNFTYECINKYVPNEYILGDGGLYIYIKLKNNLNSRELLNLCIERGIAFMPGDIFFINNECKDTIRIGFSKLSDSDIENGIKILGDCINFLAKD